MKAHYDYDVVPFDILENAVVSDGKMIINGEFFNILIVPSGLLLPQYESILRHLESNGLKVLRSDAIEEAEKYLSRPVADGTSPFLRLYQYDVNGEIRIFLLNESNKDTVEFDLSTDGSYLYDAMNDKKYAWNKHIRLLPGESLFSIRSTKQTNNDFPPYPQNFNPICRFHALKTDNLQFDFTLGEINNKRIFAEFEQNAGVLEVICNGRKFPPLFAPPYRIELSDCVKESDNLISCKLTEPAYPRNLADSTFDIEIPLKMDITINIMQAE